MLNFRTDSRNERVSPQNSRNPSSSGFVYEERLYRRCIQCTECMKALLFTEIMVCSISTLFYLVVFFISLLEQQRLPIHLLTITFQLLSITTYVVAHRTLKKRFPGPESATCKSITKLYLFVLGMIALIGFFILAKMGVDLYFISQLHNTGDPDNVNYDWLLLYLDFLFSMIGLQVIAIVEMGFMLFILISAGMFILVHTIVYYVSSRKVSLLGKLNRFIERKLQEYKTRCVKMLARFRTQLESDDQIRNLQEQACAICCEEFQREEWIYELSCLEDKPKHVFHTKCLNIWSRSNEACPTCRTNFSSLNRQS